jgi:hypothetical protein
MPQQTPSRDVKESDDYATRLLKLLPAEITGAYLAIRLVSRPETNDNDGTIAIFAIVILLISPFFMYYVLKMNQIRQIIFLMFTYVVWIVNFEIARINGHSDLLKSWSASAGEIVETLVIWLIAPESIKGIAIIWLLLLAPFVFAKGTMTAAPPAPAIPPVTPVAPKE